MKKFILTLLATVSTLSYDIDIAYKRVSNIFCGKSLTYTQYQNFLALGNAAKKTQLHTKLDECLNTDFWKKKALHRMADAKIKPIRALGVEADLYILGDYRYDYRLYAHIMSDNRDMRELLTADYHIDAAGNVVNGVIAVTPIVGKLTYANGQPLDPSKRSGMVTTQWFLSANTMFAKLPRNAAAQMYRAYLGMDIAISQGLYPIGAEPRDVDNIGISKPLCASCHSTLDPLSYPFSPYQGLEANNDVGTFKADRVPWSDNGAIFSQDVPDLRSMTTIAANSDYFKKAMTKDLISYTLGIHDLNSAYKANYDELWQSLPGLTYSFNRLIHSFVDKDIFVSAPVWRRADVVFNDLLDILHLPTNLTCVELNKFDCVNDIYLYSMGGNEPFDYQQYTRVKKFNLFSVSNFERVILSACSNSVELERGRNPKLLFKDFDLESNANHVSDSDSIKTVRELYKRFHLRVPTNQEEVILTNLKNELAQKSITSRDLAKSLCYAIGSQVEFVFY
jgi:hypothetical protein